MRERIALLSDLAIAGVVLAIPIRSHFVNLGGHGLPTGLPAVAKCPTCNTHPRAMYHEHMPPPQDKVIIWR